jgi:hypothetical protein
MTEGDPKYKDHLTKRLIESDVPHGLHDGLIEYVASRRQMGHFLTAIVSNDLREACGRADIENRRCLYEIVFFLFNYAPGPCWGSPVNVAAWLADPEPVRAGFD